ncbi:hypothetical protein C8R46DRAFT_1194645 [Mycena filopes]|nr:hypothetical protein C8R46DRAFT_1194645 [Mycena filopes]
MLHWKEFSAWITVDGQEVPEYDVQISEDEKKVTCWVPSEVGKTFSVRLKTSSFSQEIGGYLTMDGHYCSGRLMEGHSWRNRVEYRGVSDGTIVKPFIFSELALTNDDSFLAPSPSQLGLIQLAITPALAELKLHERSKKGVTQQIGLARPEPLATPIPIKNGRRTGPDIVRFFFKYRPLDVLRANGIAPQLKRKTPEDEEVLADAKEAEMLHERLKALEAKEQKRDNKRRVKDEFEKRPSGVVDLTQDGDDSGSQRNKRVKLEERSSFIHGEVIDLT